MYLIFDTETTGLPQQMLPASDKNQARVLQIAAIQLDENFKKIVEFKSLIKPDGWDRIDPKAFEAHGVTIEMCQRWGVPMLAVLDLFQSWASSSTVIAAHNIKFDQQLMHIECDYHKRSRIVSHDAGHKLFCSMVYSTEVCKIPHAKWPGKYKWPKVKEAYKFFTGQEPTDQHDALGDVRATCLIFQRLHELGVVQRALAL